MMNDSKRLTVRRLLAHGLALERESASQGQQGFCSFWRVFNAVEELHTASSSALTTMKEIKYSTDALLHFMCI
jgi:hypothetical protein